MCFTLMAAPVRLELTTHGLTARPQNFEKSPQPFIYKAFSIPKKCRLPLSYHFFGIVLFSYRNVFLIRRTWIIRIRHSKQSLLN